jgi:hypothetical protein
MEAGTDGPGAERLEEDNAHPAAAHDDRPHADLARSRGVIAAQD